MVEEKALVKNGDYQSVVYLKGVDENYRYVSGVADNLLGEGTYDLETKRCLLILAELGGIGHTGRPEYFYLKNSPAPQNGY